MSAIPAPVTPVSLKSVSIKPVALKSWPKKWVSVALPLLLAASLPISAQPLSLSASKASISFAYKVTLIPVNGTANGLSSKTTLRFDQLSETKTTVQVDLSTLKTGIHLRDEHAREALGVKEYPQAIFKLNKFTGPKSIALGQTISGQISGSFSLRGVTLPLNAPVTLTREGETLQVKTMFTINPKAHGVNVKGGDTSTKVTAQFYLVSSK